MDEFQSYMQTEMPIVDDARPDHGDISILVRVCLCDSRNLYTHTSSVTMRRKSV